MKAYLFPGQGTQTEQMASELICAYPPAAKIYKTVEDITGVNLVNLKEEDHTLTRYAQLAIITYGLASLARLQETETEQESLAFVGFSLGEYTALCAAGILSLEDLLLLVNERANLMHREAAKIPGAMYAIMGLDNATIEACVAEYTDVYPVNYNCPGQLVIAGVVSETEKAAEKLLTLGAKRAIRLNVIGAFHTPLMAPAAALLREYAQSQITFASPKERIYSNVTGNLLPVSTNFPEYLEKHMVSPVRFSEEIQALRAAGCNAFNEVGPGKVLTGFVKKIL